MAIYLFFDFFFFLGNTFTLKFLVVQINKCCNLMTAHQQPLCVIIRIATICRDSSWTKTSLLKKGLCNTFEAIFNTCFKKQPKHRYFYIKVGDKKWITLTLPSDWTMKASVSEMKVRFICAVKHCKCRLVACWWKWWCHVEIWSSWSLSRTNQNTLT
jgi:hypothetical protein